MSTSPQFADQTVASAPTEDAGLEALARRLAETNDAATNVKVTTENGEEIAIPPSAVRALSIAVEELLAGRTVTIVPNEKELTTGQAAALLQVSRPYLIRLIEDGEINCRRVGTHRRLRVSDVLAYRERRDDEVKESLRRLVEATAKIPGAYGF